MPEVNVLFECSWLFEEFDADCKNEFLKGAEEFPVEEEDAPIPFPTEPPPRPPSKGGEWPMPESWESVPLLQATFLKNK